MPSGTQTSKADLLTAFDDNATQAIEEQDHRDSIESMDLSHGVIHISTPAATTIAGAGTWAKVAGTTTQLLGNRFTMSDDNEITYTGDVDVRGIIRVSLSAVVAAAVEIEFAVAINGTEVSASQMLVNTANGEYAHCSLICYALLSDGDTIEVQVRNNDDTTSVTVEQMVVEAVGHFA